MTTRKETVRVCDVCKKRVTDEGNIHLSGHAHHGWLAIEQTAAPNALKKRRDWDVCSVACLNTLAANSRKYQ